MALSKLQNAESHIGEDLWTLFKRLNFHISKLRKLTTIPSSVLERGSFKVTLLDGRVFKARRFPSAEETEKVWQLSHFLPTRRFPKTIAYFGKALLIEWIGGERLGAEISDENIFVEAGALQRSLHNSILPEHMFQHRHSELRYWQDRLAWKIDYLNKQELISAPEADKLLQSAKLQSSDNLVIGLTHGDFCRENMVMDKRSKLYSIDLETISVSAITYDIARTIYRWPMNKQQREAYLLGYGKSSSLNIFFKEPFFWLILVIAGSTIFRHRARAASIAEPLNKLKELLEYDCSSDLLKFF